MKLPQAENNVDGGLDVDGLFYRAVKRAKPDRTQNRVAELLRRGRDVATLREICQLIPARNFESYSPDALVERARWRVGRLHKATGGLFGSGRISVLEIGCGRGEVLAALVDDPRVTRVGLDLVEDLFIGNRREAPELYDVLMLKGAAEDIPFCESSFDVVLGYNSMEHFDDPRQVVDECHRVLKPGGAMYFWFGPPWNGPYGPHLQNRIGLPFVHHLFSADVIAEYLGITGDPYTGKNGWSTAQFRALFASDPRFVCSFFREEYTWEHLWLVRELPDEFARFAPSELVIRALEVTCRKDGEAAWRRFLAHKAAIGGINLSDGIVDTQDGRTANAVLSAGARRFGIKLNNPNDPKKGDFTRYRLSIPADRGARRLSVRLHSSYRNPEYPGRIAWTVNVNNRVVHTEDISADSAPRDLEVSLDSDGSIIELEVRLDALRNCEPWSWGDASKLWVEAVALDREAHGPARS